MGLGGVVMIHASIKEGDKVTVTKKVDTEQQQKNYNSMVYEVIDEKNMQIQAPLESGKIIPLEKDCVYYLSVMSSKGMYRGEASVVSRSKDGHLHFILIELLEPMKKFQRRQYYRIDCMYEFRYKADEASEWIDATMLDMSGGGIRFTSKERHEKNDKVFCHLNLVSSENVFDKYIEADVLDSVLLPDVKSTYVTRVLFNELSMLDREELIKFIFEEERRIRRKTKGLE